jgi:hypothetical protein
MDLYERLGEPNTTHSRCYEVSRSPESISSLVEWCRKPRREEALYKLTDAELMTYEIPKFGALLFKKCALFYRSW